MNSVFNRNFSLVLLNLTYQCNQYCAHCYASDIRREHIQDRKYWVQLVHDLCSFYPGEVRLSGGEPFISPWLQTVVEAIECEGYPYSITTNGQLLEGQICDFLLSHPPKQLNFSFLATKRDVHDNLAGNANSFDRVMRAIQWCAKNGITTRVNLSLFRHALADMPGFLRVLSEAGVSEIRCFPINPTGRAFTECHRYAQTAQEYAQTVNLLAGLVDVVKPLIITVRPRCGKGNEILFEYSDSLSKCLLRERVLPSVEPDGTVFACCQLNTIEEHSLGKVNSRLREEIIASEYRNLDIREGVPCSRILGRLDICPLCVVRIS